MLIPNTQIVTPPMGAKASGRAISTSGNKTTTSTTFVDMDSAELSVTITTGASRVLVTFQGWGLPDNVSVTWAVDLTIDSVRQGGTYGIIGDTRAAGTFGGGGSYRDMCFAWLTDTLTPGPHTFRPQFRTDSNTAIIIAQAGFPASIGAIEV